MGVESFENFIGFVVRCCDMSFPSTLWFMSVLLSIISLVTATSNKFPIWFNF